MGTRRLLGYGDALVLLGGDPEGLVRLDEALGGALNLATGGASETVLNLFNAQGRVLRLGREITGRLRESLDCADRADRTHRLEAAHAVLAVTAYFEALTVAPLPFDWSEVRLTRSEQIRLAGGHEADAQGFVTALVATAPPMPAPHLPFERVLSQELKPWYNGLSSRLLRFVSGLAVWDRLDDEARSATERTLALLGTPAVGRYKALYTRLAVQVPEFGFWTGQTEHQATRVTVRRALAGVESLLAGLVARTEPVDIAAAMSQAYVAALGRPILPEGEVPTGLNLPTLDAGYIDPRFRVREVSEGSTPAAEEWWSHARVRQDLTECLAGVLTGAEATAAPVVVLGQPGAGKSVLTRVLAARLPAAGFLPVRVELRDVPAESDVQEQIEHAIRLATAEHATWPELVRAAPGCVPVVLFDGFDELLQATGVSQSDFLTRVAAFQQREADQGRPVVALVTTRTAVADRARYPKGSIALRLEPFSPHQVATWLEMWNGTNEGYFARRDLRPLSVRDTARHGELAAQPLLLLMLALYDAADNALQRGGGGPLDEAALYEDLLTAFAAREVGKTAVAPRDGELDQRVERELERLSLVAFGMLNRRRQWVTAAELTEDLRALLGPGRDAGTGFRARLDEADIALGRFFFVQRAEAVQDERRLATYEFLHATFGEYLAVRLSVHLLEQLLRPSRQQLAAAAAPVDDDLLYSLLSYVPLSSRQMMRFVYARTRHLSEDTRSRLADLLVQAMSAHALRTGARYGGYRPSERPTSSRHGLYDVNLVLLMLAVTGGFTVRRLFSHYDDPMQEWQRRVLLWHSSFTDEEWTGFVLSLRVRQTADGDCPDLAVSAADPTTDAAERLAPFPLGGDSKLPPDFSGTYVTMRVTLPWRQIRRGLEVSGRDVDVLIGHTLDPLIRFLEPELSALMYSAGTPPTTATHDLLQLWLFSGIGPSARDSQQLAAIYERCADWMSSENTSPQAKALMARMVASDAVSLPPSLVARILRRVDRKPLSENAAVSMLMAATAVLDVDPSDERFLAFARDAAAHLMSAGNNRTWLTWLTLHERDLAQGVLDDPTAWLMRADPRSVPDGLQRRVRQVVTMQYPSFQGRF